MAVHGMLDKVKIYKVCCFYDLALFHKSQLVDILSLSSLACDGRRLKKEILSENKEKYDASDYMSALHLAGAEIPIDKRSIRKLQEAGISVVALRTDEHGIPEPYCSSSKVDLGGHNVFWRGANYIAGYHRTLSFDRTFPFVHISHRGYPVFVDPSPTSRT